MGDLVRYSDLDGGQMDGQMLVGKISYIFGTAAYQDGFSVELYELEDVGDGYYAEYSSALRSRKNRKTERKLSQVSPLSSAYVGSEEAYKIPIDKASKIPRVRQEQYDLDDYQGPQYYNNINKDVVQTDLENYTNLKWKLFRNVFLTGLFGTIITNAGYGGEDALIYGAGSVASVVYLFLLSLKTDTVMVNETDNTKNLVGTPLANLRFAMPIVVLLGVSLYNTQKLSSGLAGPPEHNFGLFATVTQEQFTATVLGFLTYRLPLFVGQLRDAFQQIAVEEASNTKTGGGRNGSGSGSATLLPGSVGVAAQLLSKNPNNASETTLVTDNTVTVLLVSGPQATGRSELVAQLLASGSNAKRLVRPQRLQRQEDGATFERLQQRGEFLDLPQASSSFETTSDSSGFTAAGIFAAAQGTMTMETETEEATATTTKMIPNQNVVVIDADIDVVQRIRASSALPNVRIIGIWIGLQSVEEFETNLRTRIATGTLSSSLVDTETEEETDPERLVRSKMKEIVQEIEYGLGSGIFEFTILNEGGPTSLQELQEAATYAFK